jgi:hypothetical protein
MKRLIYYFLGGKMKNEEVNTSLFCYPFLFVKKKYFLLSENFIIVGELYFFTTLYFYKYHPPASSFYSFIIIFHFPLIAHRTKELIYTE